MARAMEVSQSWKRCCWSAARRNSGRPRRWPHFLRVDRLARTFFGMTSRTDVEQLLRRIPLATPANESAAQTALQIFMSLRNSAFEGLLDGGIGLPPVLTPFAIAGLVRQMRDGAYTEVALTLIGIAGDAASAFGFLVAAATELGTIPASATGLASAGTVATALGDAAGPAGLAATVLVATFRVPQDVSENNKKLFFIADASGILTSWIFNLPTINPHARLMARARTGGYFSTDVSAGCRLAHERVHQLWQTNYRGNATAIRAARESAQNDWERYWRQVGDALERRLVPLPHGVGSGWVNSEIADATRRVRSATRAADAAREAERQRRADGGYWFRSPEGLDLFMPDP